MRFVAIALLVGSIALAKYQVGKFSHGGPGLFPLMISCFLLVVGLLTVVRARFVAPVPLDHSVKNISLVLLSLVGFAVISEYINMLLGITFLVFCSTLAGTSYSVARNVKITLGLFAVAFAFKELLGLNLPLLGQ